MRTILIPLGPDLPTRTKSTHPSGKFFILSLRNALTLSLHSSLDFDEPFVPPGNLNGCGHDVALFHEEQSDHLHYPDFSSTPVAGFDFSEWVYESPNPETSASDAIHTSRSSLSNRVETYHDGSGSDEDAGGESEHCSPDDNDEYHPDLEISTSKKRHANAQLDRFTPEWSSSSSLSSSSRSRSGTSNSGNKRARLSFPSRNLQATPEKSLQKVNKPDPWTCPYKDCTFVQRNRRKPDLRRHIKRHTPNSGEWVCRGCLRSFSRRDSLRRHLINENIKCAGR
jgi:hypothetical protein